MVGKLHHDANRIFGPALIEAYHLEKDVAKYPRIILPIRSPCRLPLAPAAERQYR